MRVHRIPLAERRARVLAQVTTERSELASALQSLRQPLAMLDLGCSVLHFVRRHPIAMACGYASLRLILPRVSPRLGLWWRRGRLVSALIALVYGRANPGQTKERR